MKLTRSEILEVKDIKIKEVNVPEWGGSVFVKGMTGAERDKFETSIVGLRGKQQTLDMQNVRAKLAALTICDEEGTLLFSEADVKALGVKSASALQRVFKVAQKLSALTPDDMEELTQELEKNPLGDSTSG
jgi:hypothetical protein